MDKTAAIGIGGSLIAWLSANYEQIGPTILTVITIGYIFHKWYIMARDDRKKDKEK